MGERFQELKNKNFLKVVAVIGIGSTALTACSGHGVKATSTPDTAITVTAPANPSHTETSKPKPTETQTPTTPETEKPVHGYDAIINKNFPAKGQSYLDALPKMPQDVREMAEMDVVEFSHKNIDQILEVKDYVMPDTAGSANVVGKWTAETNSIPYKVPTKDMKSIDIIDNIQAEANFIQHKAGTGTVNDHVNLNLALVKNLICSQYYFDGFYTGGTYDDYLSTGKGFEDLNDYSGDQIMTGPKAPMTYNLETATKDITDNPDPTMIVNGKESPARYMKVRYTAPNGDNSYSEIKTVFYDGRWLMASVQKDKAPNFDNNTSPIESNSQYLH